MVIKNILIIEKITIVTLIFLTILISIRWELRELANDPQIGIAYNVAFNLDAGTDVSDLNNVLPQPVDGVFSQQPWVIVADLNGETIVNTGVFGTEVPKIPNKYFNNVGLESKRTWSPDQYSRQAIVIVPYKNSITNEKGYVVSGRNLEITDARISKISIFILISHALTILAIYIFNQFKVVNSLKRKN